MVAVNFKLRDIGRVELTLLKPETLAVLLQRCREKTGGNLGGVIAIRQGKILKQNELILDGDEVDIFPAISGG